MPENRMSQAGLNHDFFLLESSSRSLVDLSNPAGILAELRLSDDLICYMADTLAWIPSMNPSTNQPGHGLCQFGVTIIDQAGARVASRIFSLWASVFALGPETLCLTGLWTLDGSRSDARGNYARFSLDRNQVTQTLRQLSDVACRVADSDGDYYILHHGI